MLLIVSSKQKLMGSCVNDKQLFIVYHVNCEKSCIFFLSKKKIIKELK